MNGAAPLIPLDPSELNVLEDAPFSPKNLEFQDYIAGRLRWISLS